MVKIKLTRRLKANLNFWKMSTKSSAGGGRALICNIPSEIEEEIR